MDIDKDKLQAYRERVQRVVDEIKSDHDKWISRWAGPVPKEGTVAYPAKDAVLATRYYNEITDVLLETGIDRLVFLHGTDADCRDLLLRCFERRAEKYRQRLN